MYFILLGLGIQAEYRQTNMAPEYNKKWRAFRPLLYTFGGVGNHAEYIKKNSGSNSRALLLHTAVPNFQQEFLPEFRSSLDAFQTKIMQCPAVPAP